MNLQRTTDGKIRDGVAIILRGGHYDLFKGDGKPDRGLARVGQLNPFVLSYTGGPPCQRPDTTFPVKLLKWSPEPWTQIFNQLGTFQCNLLRLWSTGGTRVVGSGDEAEPTDLCPFKKIKRGTAWKWQGYDAYVLNQWNDEFFRVLAAFADLAAENDVALQVTLFNYLDMVRRFDGGDFRGWCRSMWNPYMSDNPAADPNWGPTHLVNPANAAGTFLCSNPDRTGAEGDRHKFFITPTNFLRLVQEEYVKKFVRTLKGRGNIIFEIMNEPRGGQKETAVFSSKVIDWILEAGLGWRPLISVNASNPIAGGTDPRIPVYDIDYWKAHSTPGDPNYIKNYDQVDIISYHGLSGLTTYSANLCSGNDGQIPPTDPQSVLKRFNYNRQNHPQKSLMYSTDAASAGRLRHKFPDSNNAAIIYEMNVRDGQIITDLANQNTETPVNQAVRSDLQNWAYWCLSHGVGNNTGLVHFQNHSLWQRPYQMIRDGLNDAYAHPAT